jgi:hypothetical protein
VTAPVLLPVESWRILWRWRTDVIPLADGTEQRACTAALPRAYFAGAVDLTDAQQRALHADRLANPTATVPVAQPHEGTPTTAAVTGAAAVVDDTYCDWIANGRRVLVVGAGGAMFDTTISSFSGGSLTLADGPSSGTYPAGATMVYPCVDTFLDDGQQVTRWPVTLTRWQLAGRQQVASSIGGAGGAAVTTYASLPVLVDRPLMAGADGESYQGGLEWADAGGAVAVSSTWLRGARSRAGSYQIRTPAERQAWKVLLGTLRGRWKPLLAPTWRPDATLQAQPAGSATALRLVESLADLAPLATAAHVQLEFADGSVAYRTISGITDAGAYRSAALTAALPGSIPGGSVRTVSMLETVRLGADDVQVEYRGDWIGRVTLPLVRVAG